LTIAGVDRTNRVPMDSYELSDSLQARGDTLTFRMPVSAGQVSTRPISNQPISLVVDGTTLFSGDIATVEEVKSINADYFDYQISCRDNTNRLDRNLVIYEKIGPDNVDSIIRQILQDFAPEFATDFSQIDTGLPVVSEQQFDYVPVSSAFDTLASQADAIWYVDSGSKRIVFTVDVNNPAPISSYDVDSELQLGDLSYHVTTDQIKNRIIIKDTKMKDSNTRTETWIADGATSFFPLSMPAYDENITASIQHADGSVPEQLIPRLDSLESDTGTILGTCGEIYVCLINQGVRLPINCLPEVNDWITATYNPVRGQEGELVFIVEDRDSQRMIREREGGASTGIYEHMVSMPDVRVESPDPIEAYGNILLNRMAWPQVEGVFASQQLTNWKAGQTFTLTSSKRDLYDEKVYWKSGKVTKTSIRMWVQSVTKHILMVDSITGTTSLLANITFTNQPFGAV